MNEMIAVSKAAKLLGLKRSEMNERLHAANIPTFEGEVELAKVRAIAPAIELCEDDILERMRHIREGASPMAADGAPPSADVDALVEMKKLNAELMVERRTAEHYLQIIVEMADRLGEMQTSDSKDERKLGIEMCQWLREKVSEE